MEALCTAESPPLHVKNPLHYLYKSKGKSWCSGPPAHPNQGDYIQHLQESSVLKEAHYLEEEEEENSPSSPSTFMGCPSS